MSRHEETTGPVPNPSQYYLEWNSEMNSFSFWHKDSQERQSYPLPMRFLALKFVNSITGFDEVRKQGLYSNEVSDTRKEKLRVFYRDGTPCIEGYYSEIKEHLSRIGGKFTRSIYACTPKEVIINIKLKGSQIINFGTIEKHGTRWQDEWIEVRTFETKTHEEKEYSLPIFTFCGSLSATDSNKADKLYATVKNYFVSKGNSYSAPVANQATPELAPSGFEQIEDDDLPF